MYFEELKKALYLDDEYSFANLQRNYEHENESSELDQNMKISNDYSLIEIMENLEEFGLRGNKLGNMKYQYRLSQEEFNELLENPEQYLLRHNENIDMLIQEVDNRLKELENEETKYREEQESHKHLYKGKWRQEKKNNTIIFEDIYKYAPQDTFSQEYKIRYIKTILQCFIDIYSGSETPNDAIKTKLKCFIEHKSISKNISEMILLVIDIISPSEKQLNGMIDLLTYRKIQLIHRIKTIKKYIKQYIAEDILKTPFSSENLERWRFYGQIISFIVSIERKKEDASFSYEEEAISYIAYFLADAILKKTPSSIGDAVLLAKKGLKITNLSDQQVIFNILGVSAIDSGQKQLAYDAFFSWLNCCPVGELIDIIPFDLFTIKDNKTWRKDEGSKAVARMKGNFAYVCGKICDTYEPHSKRWDVFHNIALNEISGAIKLNSDDSSYHCTYGTLLSENVWNNEGSLLSALEEFKLYKQGNLQAADKLDSSRIYCETLLDILSESFIKQDRKDFFQLSEDKIIQTYFEDFRVELKKYSDNFQDEDDGTENRELLNARKAKKSWEPYFKLQGVVEEYKEEVPEILNLELLLVLIRNIADIIRKSLRRWEYNLTDYYTRNEQNDQGITGQRSDIKPIAYYTTLDTIKFVFDDLYQEVPNQAPRKIKEGEKGKNCLTVSHAKYMNDPYEGLTLLREFLNYIEEKGDENILFPDGSPVSFRESILNRHFVFLKSFTECIDNLVMWNRYASDYDSEGRNSNGCCVQLDAETFGQIVDFSGNDEASIKLENVPEDDYYLYRVVYISKDGTVKMSENPGLFPQVVEYYNALRNLICTLNNYLKKLKSTLSAEKGDKLIEYVREFLQQTFHIILFLFKDSDYSDEVESRLIFVRTPNQQEEIRLLPTSPEKLCINPFFQVFISQIIFGPNVRDQEQWIPYFQYQLNKMWRKHPSLSDKMEEFPCTRYSIENSRIHYHT